MNTAIYKKYDFHFDKNLYLKTFKDALTKHGIDSPAQLDALLKNVDCDYESVKSYFYVRRVPPLKVLATVCEKFNLRADEIALPNSMFQLSSTIEICGSVNSYLNMDETFRNVFIPYNPTDDNTLPDDPFEFMNDKEAYLSDVNTAAIILSKYNYLIQKYNFTDVSNDELIQIANFTEKYISDRDSGEVQWDDVSKWIHKTKTDDFLDCFYKKYQLSFYGSSCSLLVNLLLPLFSDNIASKLIELLPQIDRPDLSVSRNAENKYHW